MVDNMRYVINMANSIIGVSILSMPYCFKEVGVVLGTLLLILCGFITKKTCMFLVKSAIMARRRSYELLAFQVFGVTGKLFMELCMILFLLGICISFHVVIGDLAPSIVAKYTLFENTPSLRCTLLIGIVLLVILPLCLLRNIDSLASLSACSIGFYVFLNFVIFYAALPKLLNASWIYSADLFHIEKTFNVLPIMLLAMACQSNVFEIYSSIPDPDVHVMNSVVNHAINICCGLYIGVGFLGYVAFYDKDIGGNIIMSFNSSNLTDGITMFFVISLVISFPLMLFPCRTSLHSLIYKRNVQVSSFDSVGTYMPEFRFKIITFTTLAISLVFGIMIPNIEFVLGLLGSTMGMWIALLLPSIFYIRVYTKLSLDRLIAQGLMFLGVFLMIMGTYLHLMNFRVQSEVATLAPPIKVPEAPPLVNEPLKVIEKSIDSDVKLQDSDMTGRKEPAIPEPPAPQAPEVNPPEGKGGPEILKKVNDPPFKSSSSKPKSKDVNYLSKVGNDKPPKLDPNVLEKPVEKEAPIVKKEIREEDLHPDAIRKEEKENAEEKQVKEEAKEVVYEKKQEEILKKLEEHQKEQVKILEAQKEILQELKDQKEKVENNDAEVGGVGLGKDAAGDIANVPQQGIQSQKLDPDSIHVQQKEPAARQDVQKMSNSNANVLSIDENQIPVVKDPIQNQAPLNAFIKPELQGASHQDLKLSEANQRNVISPAQYVESHANLPIRNGIRSPELQNAKEKDEIPNNIEPLKPEDRVLPNPASQSNGHVNKQALNKEELPLKVPPDLDRLPRNDQAARHDEERKKRDVSQPLPPGDQSPAKGSLVASKNLLSPEVSLPEKSAVEDAHSAKDVGVLYDSRHLLWDKKKIRRRKRRNDHYPDYWEEM